MCIWEKSIPEKISANWKGSEVSTRALCYSLRGNERKGDLLGEEVRERDDGLIMQDLEGHCEEFASLQRR